MLSERWVTAAAGLNQLRWMWISQVSHLVTTKQGNFSNYHPCEVSDDKSRVGTFRDLNPSANTNKHLLHYKQYKHQASATSGIRRTTRRGPEDAAAEILTRKPRKPYPGGGVGVLVVVLGSTQCVSLSTAVTRSTLGCVWSWTLNTSMPLDICRL